MTMLLNMPGEEEHCKFISEEEIVEQMLAENENNEESEDQGNKTAIVPLPFRGDVICSTAIVKRYALGTGVLSGSLNQELCSIQRIIRNEAHTVVGS